MIPGQGVATQNELLNELNKAEAQGNNQLVASLLETMLSKGYYCVYLYTDK